MTNIRPMKTEEKEAVVALWKAAGLVRPWKDPGSDIDLAVANQTSEILVLPDAGNEDSLIAAVMVGMDGHRGWVYYLAVHPDRQGEGLGRLITQAAENWLSERSCPKINLMIRGDNIAVRDFYTSVGYAEEDRRIMRKWLIEPPSGPDVPVGSTDDASRNGTQNSANDDAPIQDVPVHDVTITYLEMTSPPSGPARHIPNTRSPLALQRLHAPTVSFYRYLHHTVGDPWLWYERRTWQDDKLASVISDAQVEIYLLSEGGVPAGFVELDFRMMPETAEVAYFGLLPDFIGRGLGPYLLDWGIRTAWNRTPAPQRLTVNTCTLDHPAALGGYQKAGFIPYHRETTKVKDPVALGIIPS